MASSFVLSKQVFFTNLILKNKCLPRLLISSKSFCSKDNESSNEQQKSDESAAKTAEKQAKKASEETKEISEQNVKTPEESKEAAKKTIANLISEIEVPSDSPEKTTLKLNLAKPVKRITKKERLEIMKANESTPEKEMDLAIKNVASNFKDAEKVESELSEKLRTINSTKETTEEDEVIVESELDSSMNERLISSVEDVAETISESPIPPRTELTQRLLERSSEKQTRPERQRSMYYDDGPRYRYRRGGRMPVIDQLRLEAQLAAAKKASLDKMKKSAPKYYNDDPGSRYRFRRNEKMSVIERMRQEARFSALDKKDSAYESKKPTSKDYKDWPEASRHDHRSDDRSVIGQMRKEARYAAFDRKDSAEEEKPMSRQYKDWPESPRRDDENDIIQYKDCPEPRRHDDERDEIKYEDRPEPRRRDGERDEIQYKDWPEPRRHDAERDEIKYEDRPKPHRRDGERDEIKYEDRPKPRRRDGERDEMQYKDWPESRRHDRESGEMSVIEQMRKEARFAAFDRKDSVEDKRSMSRPQISKIDLFGATPLNIFSMDSETKIESRNVLWQKLQEKQLRLLSQFAPSNGFEEMIMWTEQGKHWKFPIDNETEMGAEENIGFNEHIFLEQHLKGFPTRGPIRHFMELVTVGLSKNPYITVQRKIDNIEWFRQYFKEKEDILKETGAIE